MEALQTNIKKVATAVPTPTTPASPVTTAAPAAYTVGGSYAVDNSAYASGTDANAIALQAYDRQLAAYKAALQAGYDSQAQSIAAQAAKLKDQYNASRNDIYTNARLSAIGNNERLAARGLAGNLYDYARSGTSESSRIAQDVAMRKALAQQHTAEINANSDLDIKLIEAQREADAKYAEYAAKNEENKIPYLMALANAANMSGGGGGGGGYSYSSSKKKSSSSGSSGSSGTYIYDSTNVKNKDGSLNLANKDNLASYYAKNASTGISNYQTKEGTFVGTSAYNAALQKAKDAAKKSTASTTASSSNRRISGYTK